ncbi:unnamed protein product [Sphagnum balticum]
MDNPPASTSTQMQQLQIQEKMLLVFRHGERIDFTSRTQRIRKLSSDGRVRVAGVTLRANGRRPVEGHVQYDHSVVYRTGALRMGRLVSAGHAVVDAAR